jgi:hypothetical protein
MSRFPRSVCCSLLGCTWLLSLAPVAAQAQLNLAIGDDDVVTLQNGSAPPLVVKPGQSFGGTLTSKGFQGVMTGPQGTQRVTPQAMPPSTANPFRDAPVAKKPLKINAGGVSLTLPMAPEPAAEMPALPRQKLQMARNLVRMSAPTARKELEKLMRAHAPDADLLQLMALVLMQAERDREAAACVYDALQMDACWTWSTLRTSLPDKDAATMMYRRLQRMALEQPSLERDVLLAWWERMLDHRPEAMVAMQRAAAARPHDALFLRLMSAWSTDHAAPPPKP